MTKLCHAGHPYFYCSSSTYNVLEVQVIPLYNFVQYNHCQAVQMFRQTSLSIKTFTNIGVRKGGLGTGVKPPPLSLICYKNFITRAKDIVFADFLLVNLSTSCKYHGMNLHANFKEHCKWAKK